MNSTNPVIRIRGAAENNLAHLDLDLPLGRWIAVTGPSGSGKTSLVFDTLVREGERRFLGSLTPRARHFFGKLGRAEVDSIVGLPATIAVGQHTTTPNSRSTVGTLTGTLDLLRLLFARAARDADGTHLTRSHFSFNHPAGQCETCHGLGLEDRVDPSRIIADPTLSIREGALVPTLKNGYTVYSQVTLPVMDQICHAHGFSVDVAWQDLSPEQQSVILCGTRALKVPFGKHSIESRMKWEGITARPREEGYYPGLVPVIEETLKRNRNENILRFVTSGPCHHCEGTRLARTGREALFGDCTLPELLAMPASDWSRLWTQLPEVAVWKRVRPALEERITRMSRLGLGHLSLDRTSTSLSGGEAQRVRLAAQLGAGLSGVLFALDEPTLGLHPESHLGMKAVLDELIEQGNTLVVVEHDPDMVRHADHVVALGPGADTEGGRIVTTDWPGQAESGPRLADPLGGPPTPRRDRRPGRGTLTLSGATLHNLSDVNLQLVLGNLNVVMGPSGAGKSSLVFGTLLPALLGNSGGPFRSLERADSSGDKNGSPTGTNIAAVDARPIGKTPRSTPATWCGLFDLVRRQFGKLEEARSRGLTASHFSFNSVRGRCPTCAGLGVTRLGLHLFQDVELTCDTCQGSRYGDDVLTVRMRGKTIAEVLAMTFLEAQKFFAEDKDASALAGAMVTLGLGYLALGQSSSTLSRGEAQRIKLGTLLGSKRSERSIILLDEPDRGLAPTDIVALLYALDALVVDGHTIVAISHHRHIWAAADRLIEVREGRTEHAPTVDWNPTSTRRSERAAKGDAVGGRTRPIELRGVRTHNLKGIDVNFPRGQLTAVCGVSGSGKSSLVFDTLSAEAEARFAESLPFQVRRFLRRLPQPRLESARGLTPALNLRQGSGQTSARSTVATQSECGPLLRLIFSRAGLRNGKPCGLSASHFSRERVLGACPDCAGKGTHQHCDPQRLITDPERPLIRQKRAGTPNPCAMHGTRPGRFFTEHDGQYMATLIAALSVTTQQSEEQLFEVLSEVPWRELAPALQQIALHGTGATRYLVTWKFASQVEGSGHHQFEATWGGLCSLVEQEAKSRARSRKAAEWTAPLGDAPCGTCSGSGLARPARETTVRGHSLPSLLGRSLVDVLPTLGAADTSTNAVLDALLPELAERLEELVALGLGHLSLSRTTSTLSRGELQRVRLAGVLRSGLSGITLVLDEPTAGLHERDVQTLRQRLRRFQEEGNTVVLVSHRPSLLSAADYLVELGPGAGAEGGHLVSAGPPDTRTEKWDPELNEEPTHTGATPRILIEGARAHNLQGLDVEIPLAGFVCITGVSGSGKSSLAFDVLGASAKSRTPIACAQLSIPGGWAHFTEVHDAREIGVPRTALAALNIANEVAALFAHPGMATRAFKPGDAAGRCPACRGTGRERVALDFLADLDLPCQACQGSRFRPEVLEVTWEGATIANLLDEPAALLLEKLDRPEGHAPRGSGAGHARLRSALQALESVAAAHIPLGRPRNELSGGESARLGLAANLLHACSPCLYLFDEPSTGLHESDLRQVVATLRNLAGRGNLVVATEHRLSTIAAADWVVDLGPEGGPEGGRLIEAGPPQSLSRGHTAAALRG